MQVADSGNYTYHHAALMARLGLAYVVEGEVGDWCSMARNFF